MSEKIVIAHHSRTCDLCGTRIPKGTQCRMIRDDFLPFLTYFEHVRCPGSLGVPVTEPPPRPPKIQTLNYAHCMA